MQTEKQNNKGTETEAKGDTFKTIAKSLGTSVQAHQVGDIYIQGGKDALARRITLTTALILLFTALAISSYYYVTDWSIEPDTDQYLTWLSRGDSLFTEQEFEQARDAYSTALKYSTGDSAAYKKIELIDMANQYVEMGDYTRAEQTFEMVLTIDPDLELDVGLEDEESLVEKLAKNPSQMVVRIKRLPGGIIEIRVSGGRPFPDPAEPYKITGLSSEAGKIEWRKEAETYVARLTNMRNESILSIKIKDSNGKSQQSELPAITKNEQFADQLTIADDLYAKQQFSQAIEGYEQALTIKANDQYCLGQITKCEQAIEALEAQNPEMVFVKGGTFLMGRNEGEMDEVPAHEVTISAFYISKYEVSVKEYRSFCQATGRNMPKTPTWGWKDDHPIVNVTWKDAVAYCQWAGGRLPTEAEWEFAARGAHKTNGFAYSGSSDPKEAAWYRDNTSSATSRPRGTTPVYNELGVADMSGNVWEWCNDWYGSVYYATSPQVNPSGPLTGTDRVFRGGSWKGLAEFTAVTYRNHRPPNYLGEDLGFRVVKEQLNNPTTS